MAWEWQDAYREYGTDVYRFLLLFTASREDAEDLTQETFIRVFRSGGPAERICENGGPLKQLLLRVARNAAVDLFRHTKARQRLSESLQHEWSNASTETETDPAVRREEIERLYRAITELQANYRAVLVLHGIEELSVAETSEILDWSQNKVKVTYHRASKALRQRLQGANLAANGKHQRGGRSETRA